MLYHGPLSTQEYINFLQRFVIVNSYIYYEMNDNAISDMLYDKRAKELVALKNRFPDFWKTSEYYEQFGDDYNGATGFTLFHSLNNRQKEIILAIAYSIMRRKGEKSNGIQTD